MTKKVQKNWIASFWKRIGALFIDILILCIVGFLLGLALENMFIKMGGWARFIGFGVTLIYFGVMNSKLFEGQTIGKKFFKLRVVNFENQSITLWRSILRCIILTTPFFLNNNYLYNEIMLSFLIYPFSLIISGGALSILYLYFFNKATRQSLHDLLMGTYVVNVSVERQKIGKVWRTHLIIVSVLFIASAIIPVFVDKFVQREPFKEMLTVQTAILDEPRIMHTTISTRKTINEGGKATTHVSIQAFIASNNISDNEFARHLATIAIHNYPKNNNIDTLQITLICEYNIGIWSKWSYLTYNFNPTEL